MRVGRVADADKIGRFSKGHPPPRGMVAGTSSSSRKGSPMAQIGNLCHARHEDGLYTGTPLPDALVNIRCRFRPPPPAETLAPANESSQARPEPAQRGRGRANMSRSVLRPGEAGTSKGEKPCFHFGLKLDGTPPSPAPSTPTSVERRRRSQRNRMVALTRPAAQGPRGAAKAPVALQAGISG